MLLEILAIVLVDQHQINKMLDLEPIVDVLVGGRQVYSRQVQPDGHDLVLDGAPVHNLELFQCFDLVLDSLARPEALLADDAQLHRFDLDLHLVEEHPAHYTVLQVVLGFGVLELDVQAVIDPHLQLDRRCRLGVQLGGRDLHREVRLLRDVRVVVPVEGHPQEISHPASNTVERLVLLLEARELEGEAPILGQEPRRLQLFGHRHEVRAEVLVAVDF